MTRGRSGLDRSELPTGKECIEMAKKSYQRPTLTRGGAFAHKTAGSLFTNCRESYVTQKPRAICS
ncbi:hypothetical protein FHU28_003095 [Micromonospora echinospora]|uniref:Uncharacterized protein n=1 Tax=Micromonospora echinospora TaxID=1877 RepID=A0ABR6MF59_MICEC|nr:keywimysin-related RiPP [Micromonospora echinospora]MBB5113256.1 hypothetical protein [Micromonospora echinospora]